MQKSVEATMTGPNDQRSKYIVLSVKHANKCYVENRLVLQYVHIIQELINIHTVIWIIV